jgi:hypothetical protein
VYVLIIGRPFCCKFVAREIGCVYMIYICIRTGFSSSCVIDPRCFLCDLFLPLFLQQDRHLGIWHSATWRDALMSQFLFFCSISLMSACAYVSWRRISSCWGVFRLVIYVVGSVMLCLLLTVTRVCPLKLGCCANVVGSGLDEVFCLMCIM